MNSYVIERFGGGSLILLEETADGTYVRLAQFEGGTSREYAVNLAAALTEYAPTA